MKYYLTLLILCFAAVPAFTQVEEKIGEAEIELRDSTISAEEYKQLAFSEARKNALSQMSDVVISQVEKENIGLGDYENEQIQTSFQSYSGGLVKMTEKIAEGTRKRGDKEYYYFKARFSRDMSFFKEIIMDVLEKSVKKRTLGGKISGEYTLEELLSEELSEEEDADGGSMTELYVDGLSMAGMDADIEIQLNGIKNYFRILSNNLSNELIYGQIIPGQSKTESADVQLDGSYTIRYDIGWKWSYDRGIKKEIRRFSKIYKDKFRKIVLNEIEKINSGNDAYKLELDKKGGLRIITRKPKIIMQLLSSAGKVIRETPIVDVFDNKVQHSLNFSIGRSELGNQSNYTLKIIKNGISKESLVFSQADSSDTDIKKRKVYDMYAFLLRKRNNSLKLMIEGLYAKNASNQASAGGVVSLGYRGWRHYLGVYAGLLPNPYPEKLKEAGNLYSFGLDYRYYLFTLPPKPTRDYDFSVMEKRHFFYPFAELQLGSLMQSGGANMTYSGYTGELRLGIRIGSSIHLSVGAAYINLSRKGEVISGELRNPPVPAGISGMVGTVRLGFSF